MTKSPNPDVIVNVLALGAFVGFTLGGFLVRSVKMQGDASVEWTERIERAESKLDAKAMNELEQLRDETDEVLGDPELGTDPSKLATADPTPLFERAKKTTKLFAARKAIGESHTKHLRVAPWETAFLIGALVADVLLTLYYSNVIDESAVRIVGLIFAAVCGTALLVLFALELIYRHRMSSSEALAEKREVAS